MTSDCLPKRKTSLLKAVMGRWKTRKKKNTVTQYDQYVQTLPDAQKQTLSEFFAALNEHMTLSKKTKAAMRADFENAVLYYAAAGIPLDTALRLLSVENLGGFYTTPPVLWYPLDDAAKIYPLAMKHDYMAVFRLSVYLRENVVAELLQIALTFTIKRFPSFATTVKKGFFWHYLDAAKRRFCVQQESDIPCRPLRISKSQSQSFRVLYYQKRISVEFFHILTDGTGGMVFLKTLVAEYLRLLGVCIKPSLDVLDINDSPTLAETANSFIKTEDKGRSGFVDKPATQLSGSLSRICPCKVLHFKLDAQKLKTVAKSKNATITAYILALMFIAAKSAICEPEGSVNIQVPVNMRKFYQSETLRNFALYCGIRQDISQMTDADSLLPDISRQLTQKASLSTMNEMMNATVGLVRAMRYIPLFIKGPAARLVYGFLGDRIFTNTLSNLGVVKLPEDMAPYVDHFDFVLGTMIINRVSCALVTFQNTVMLTVSKRTQDPSFEEKLYKLLKDDGLEPVVEGSPLYES